MEDATLSCPSFLQGIETVRRDNCLLVRNIVTTVLEMILIDRDERKAKDFVRSTIADLLMNRLDLSLLVITKVSSPDTSLHTPSSLPWRHCYTAILSAELTYSIVVVSKGVSSVGMPGMKPSGRTQ